MKEWVLTIPVLITTHLKITKKGGKMMRASDPEVHFVTKRSVLQPG